MNLLKLFEFIKEKRGYKVPLIYKLIEGLPLSEDELTINGNLDLYGENISLLPDNLTVGGYLILSYTKINSLPDNLKVGNLDLRDTKITSLPDNFSVGGDLYLGGTNITSLPNNLKVGRSLFLGYTPLSKKYSKEQIIKMIEDKGGYVKGKIYT